MDYQAIGRLTATCLPQASFKCFKGDAEGKNESTVIRNNAFLKYAFIVAWISDVEIIKMCALSAFAFSSADRKYIFKYFPFFPFA